MIVLELWTRYFQNILEDFIHRISDLSNHRKRNINKERKRRKEECVILNQQLFLRTE